MADLTLLLQNPTEAQKDTMLSKECMASSWSDVFAERDSLCAKIAELKNALHVYADKYGHEAAECDSLRAKNAELERELKEMEQENGDAFDTLNRHLFERNEAYAERDRLQARVTELERLYFELDQHLRDSDREIIAMERSRDEARAEAARLREALEQIANGSQDIMSQRIAREALAPRETEGGR